MTSEDRAFAANTELRMYDAISCESDRQNVKSIVKEQLAMYSWLFEQEVARTTGGLRFVKIPAAAHMGLKMKDDMRATKERLDATSASLR